MRRLTESVCLDGEGAALLEDVEDLLCDGLTGGEGAEDGVKPVSGETERGHRGRAVGSGGGGCRRAASQNTITHTENPSLFVVEVSCVLRNYQTPSTDIGRPPTRLESPATPCMHMVLIRHCII